MALVVLIDRLKKKYSLGNRLGGGGEGDVYQIVEDQDLVAKIYKGPLTIDKREKLFYMVTVYSDTLKSIAAWPKELLYDNNSNLRGFLMPKVEGFKPIHELYNPASRKKNFPDADFSFLVHTSKNLAAAFATIHANGFIVGDINEGNIFVSDSSIIKLIDCDSFQVTKDNKTFPCEVGIPMYTPPELQGVKSFRDIMRTKNHDIFGLSIMIFQLIFMGRHPFVGLYKGPDTPLDKAIEKYWFAYGDNGIEKGISPPAETLRFNAIPTRLQALFNNSFTEIGKIKRPIISEWVDELNYLKKHLRVCNKETKHKYFEEVSFCPWCELENKKGIFFFISSKVGAFNLSGFSLNDIWLKLNSISLPAEESIDPNKIKVTSKQLPSTIQLLMLLSITQKLLAVGVPLILCFYYTNLILVWVFLGIFLYKLEVFNRAIRSEKENRQHALLEAEKKWKSIKIKWETEASSSLFEKKKIELQSYKQKYERLGEDYNFERRNLHQRMEEIQMQKFLSNYFIRSHTIANIGDNRKTTLTAYGIETAADAIKLKTHKIPGFGDALAKQLLSWRATLAQRFKFDPTKGIDPEEINQLNKKFENTKTILQNNLKNGVDELNDLKSKIIQSRMTLKIELIETAKEFAQATKDFGIF